MQNPILLVILGILFTAIIQSSTAATGVFIAFLSAGVISNIDQSFFLVMGANIGTCTDGIMASITTNASGKRIALFHLITSIIGAISFTIILIVLRAPIINIFESIFVNKPQFSLATFNLIYNFLYTLVLLIFLDPLVDFAKRLIKDKNEELEELSYIDVKFLKTPNVAVEQALKETHDMATLAKENLDRAFTSLINEDMSESKKIADIEYRIDFLTTQITSFLIKISSVTKSAEDEKLIGGLHHVASDIERLGDYAIHLIQETNNMKQHDVQFLEPTKEELKEIYVYISKMFNLSFDAFTKRRTDNFNKIFNLHKKIKKLIIATRNKHVERLISKKYPVEISKNIYTILFALQRISDHIVNIAFSIKSTTGSKKEAFQIIKNENKIN